MYVWFKAQIILFQIHETTSSFILYITTCCSSSPVLKRAPTEQDFCLTFNDW